MKLKIVLVEPLYDGNIGSVARAAKNFGFTDLVLVNPPQIGDFGLAMASHAKDVLTRAQSAKSLQEAVAGADLVVGTTGKRTEGDGHHLRLHLRVPALTPKELAEKLEVKDVTVALLFGREDWGLSSEELMACDILVSIPTSEEYPVMNLSHSAAILLYELSRVSSGPVRLADHNTMNILIGRTERLLHEIRYPEHKIEYVMLMLRRVFGRAELTEREANTILGILKRALWRLEAESNTVEGTLEGLEGTETGEK